MVVMHPLLQIQVLSVEAAVAAADLQMALPEEQEEMEFKAEEAEAVEPPQTDSTQAPEEKVATVGVL